VAAFHLAGRPAAPARPSIPGVHGPSPRVREPGGAAVPAGAGFLWRERRDAAAVPAAGGDHGRVAGPHSGLPGGGRERRAPGRCPAARTSPPPCSTTSTYAGRTSQPEPAATTASSGSASTTTLTGSQHKSTAIPLIQSPETQGTKKTQITSANCVTIRIRGIHPAGQIPCSVGQVACPVAPCSCRDAGGGAPITPQGAIDGTLKCEPPECYHGNHLRDSTIIGRWPGLRGGSNRRFATDGHGRGQATVSRSARCPVWECAGQPTMAPRSVLQAAGQ
jgi:hypothetical protein